MGPLVHCFAAEKVLGSDDSLVLLGAILPDLGWMDKELNCPKLHEGGLELKAYLEKKNPKFLPLALGMLTHGVKYGLDKYSDIDWQGKGKGWAHLLAPHLYQEVTQACLVDPKTGRQLAHNFIEWAVEYWLDKKHPDLKNNLGQAFRDKEAVGKTAEYLADCFGVDQRKIKGSLQKLGKLYNPQNFSSLKGVVNIGDGICQMILGHKIDRAKAEAALRKATEIVKDEWEGFLKAAIFEIRKEAIFGN